MKKNILTGALPLLAVFGMALSSCGNSKVISKVSMSLDSVAIDTTVALVPHDATSPKAHVKLLLVYAKGGNARQVNDAILGSDAFKSDFVVDKSLKGLSPREAVNKFVNDFIGRYRKDCGPIYAKDRTSKSLNDEFFSNGEVVEHGGDTVCVLFHKYVYTGGANGLSTTVAMNIDRKTGKIIGKDELLKTISLDKTRDGIVKYLAGKLQVKGLEGLHGMGVFTDREVYIPDNFMLGRDSIIFLYGAEEIAPHYLGEVKVAVPVKEIKNR
ncbi:MAG: RsiV family protein [Prevotella sp.]|jgi:hypothetical protein